MSSPFVARIDLYPLKAFDTVVVETALVLPSGALEGDRRWAFVDGQERFVNGKRHAETHRIRTAIDPVGRTATFEGTTFSLDRDVEAVEAWVSARLQTLVRLREHAAAGFPDDTESPGPTLIATATLEAVAGWFDLSLEEARARFRANLEIGGVPAFWEDAFYGATCQVGAVPLVLVNPCARCVVPSRDPRTGADFPGFQKQFAERRRATLGPAVDPAPFDHFYRLAVNTRLAPSSRGGTIRVGDPVAVGTAAATTVLETPCPS